MSEAVIVLDPDGVWRLTVLPASWTVFRFGVRGMQ